MRNIHWALLLICSLLGNCVSLFTLSFWYRGFWFYELKLRDLLRQKHLQNLGVLYQNLGMCPHCVRIWGKQGQPLRMPCCPGLFIYVYIHFLFSLFYSYIFYLFYFNYYYYYLFLSKYLTIPYIIPFQILYYVWDVSVAGL